MGNRPKKIVIPENATSEGVTIEYIKRRDVIIISGWYDHIVGIESTEISMRDFADRLGIDLAKKRRIENVE